MRMMGLDVGEKRIGLAYANFLSVGSSVVVPGGFLLVQARKQALEDLADLAAEEGVNAVVVGLPLRDGAETTQSKRITQFALDLKPLLGGDIALHFWDESLTSVAAGDKLVEAELKHSGKRRRGRVDAVAATLMLQGFLDSGRMYLPPLGPVI